MAFWDGQRWVAERAPEPERPSGARRVLVHSSQALLEGGLIAVLVGGLIVGTAFAARGGGGCTPAAPRVAVQNTYAWASWGSYGMAGQTLQFQVSVSNYDAGCRASTFVLDVSAPDGFSVSLPEDTVSLRSGRTAYLSAWVTSPNGADNGDYQIVASAVRSGSTAEAAASGDSFTSYYMVYSSDGAPPDLYWATPGDGSSIDGRSYNISVSARDNRSVKKIELFLDDALAETMNCDGISFSCQLVHRWSTTDGSHTATFRARDWMGNISSLTNNFTVD